MAGTSDIEQFCELFPEPALAKDLTTVLEDYRINSRLKVEYPVLGEQIAAMNGHMVSKRPSLEDLATNKQRAVELIVQMLMGGSTKEHVPKHLEETLDRALAISRTLSSPGVDVHETARVVADVYFLIDDSFQEPYQPVPPFSSPLDQSHVDRNVGNFGRTARKIREKLDRQDSSYEQDNDQMQPSEQSQSQKSAEEQRVSEDTVKKLLRTLFKEKGIKPIEVESRIEALEPSEVKDYLSDLETVIRDENGLQREQGTFLYREWGSDIGDYRPNWTRVRERSLEGGSNAFYQSTLGKYKGLIKSIRREFQMLRPAGLVKLREQFDGNDIDLDAAVQYFIDKRLRLSPSERNYMRTERRSRDIAVAFLVDVSGSTGGATIACEKEALIVMSEALEELGDAFAIYGFSGYGRDNVVFYTIKDFEDTYDRRVQTKISILTNEQSTRIAPAIRHTTTKLNRREENTKLIILLSDGKPLDHDYHGDYAIEDTRMALREAQRYGIKSFCITVDREAAEYLPRMYANSRWVVIDDVMKLPNKITRIYKLFTT
jgi:nitric oxide reductase NorD protein